MRKIELINTAQSREVGIVEFLNEPVSTDSDFRCSGPQRITLDQAKEISRLMMPTEKHGGAATGKVKGPDGIEWRL
jgi:hypothetical protein